MYSIVLANGKTININADEVEWREKSHTIRLINDSRVIARINMDNVVGWLDANYIAESEDKE